jgi:hypothetical protein
MAKNTGDIKEGRTMSRPKHAHGHSTSIIVPSATIVERLQNEAMQTGRQCPRCRYWNLQHRKMCKRCGKRIRPSATQLRQIMSEEQLQELRTETKRLKKSRREARRKLRALNLRKQPFAGTFGAASPMRRIDPKTGKVIDGSKPEG